MAENINADTDDNNTLQDENQEIENNEIDGNMQGKEKVIQARSQKRKMDRQFDIIAKRAKNWYNQDTQHFAMFYLKKGEIVSDGPAHMEDFYRDPMVISMFKEVALGRAISFNNERVADVPRPEIEKIVLSFRDPDQYTWDALVFLLPSILAREGIKGKHAYTEQNKPTWWPASLRFCSPNSSTADCKRLSVAEMRQALGSFLQNCPHMYTIVDNDQEEEETTDEGTTNLQPDDTTDIQNDNRTINSQTDERLADQTTESQTNNGTTDTQTDIRTTDSETDEEISDSKTDTLDNRTTDPQTDKGTTDTQKDIGTTNSQTDEGISDSHTDTLDNRTTDSQMDKGTTDTQTDIGTTDSQTDEGISDLQTDTLDKRTTDSHTDKGTTDTQTDIGTTDSQTDEGISDLQTDTLDKRTTDSHIDKGTTDTQTDIGTTDSQTDDILMTKVIKYAKEMVFGHTKKDADFLLSACEGIKLTLHNMYSVKDKLSDEIIDSYILSVLRREESNLEYINCAQLAMFLSKRNQAAVTDFEFVSEEAFGVHNIGRKHWVLVIIKFKSRELIVLDPLGELSLTLRMILTSWTNYLRLKSYSHYHQWKVVTKEHPKQQDSTSCGVYCLMFAEKYITRQTMDFEAGLESVASFRENILQTVLENPDEDLILKICRICSRQEPRRKAEDIYWVGCDRCGMYWCHFSCIKVDKKTSFSTFISNKWFCRFCK